MATGRGAGIVDQLRASQLLVDIGLIVALLAAIVVAVERFRLAAVQTLRQAWRTRIAYFLVFPALACVIIWNYIPAGMAAYYSLTNRAAFAQPHPILRLELDDRFGATVATRDFEPADYLKDSSQATRLIAPGSTAEAELLLADPGTEAVGYRLDACLRESATLLRCASGPG